MFVLRPYQEDCLDAIVGAIPADQNILVQAATGAGKTIVFCALIQRLLAKWPQIRIGILAHRRELIFQAQDKLLQTWPEAPIGIACASTGERVDTDRPVVIGSIQTLARRVKTTAPFDLIIVDEAHRIPPINQKSQYQAWLKIMRQYNPDVRVVGLTATPYRLGHGYIYGAVKKKENENLFSALHYRIGIDDLQQAGYLCAYRAKEVVNISQDLSGVKVSGDYNIGELSDVMIKKEHIGSAVHALKQYAADRRRAVVFAVTIDHAERLMDAFRSAGYRAATVHSKMPIAKRDLVLRSFEAGQVQVLTNVGVLTEGWDSPAVDCILMCRPTKSPALYCQMVGRGLRPHRDKKDVLVLDLANNCSSHGDPANPTVTVPNRSNGNIAAPLKSCPKCLELVPVQSKECSGCGYCWPREDKAQIDAPVDMADVAWSSRRQAPVAVYVENVHFDDYVSRAGNLMMRLSLTCSADGHVGNIFVNEFFDFDGNNDWARSKSRRIWQSLVGTDPPESVSEAVDRRGEMLMSVPEQIEIMEKGKWWNVAFWGVKPWNECQQEIQF